MRNLRDYTSLLGLIVLVTVITVTHANGKVLGSCFWLLGRIRSIRDRSLTNVTQSCA